MGSFQQISIGVVCLIAAFAFGNYVNTHPSGEHPRDALAEGDVSSDTTGNVESRLVSGIEMTEKRPASIATMRTRLEPRFSMPGNRTPTGLAAADTLDPLPPPSQLDLPTGNQTAQPAITPTNPSNNSALSSPNFPLGDLGLSNVTPRMAKASDVPDFSSIMNEFAGSPLAIQPLAKMPQHSAPKDNRTAHAVAKPRNNSTGTPLKDLASEFKSAIAQRKPAIAQPWNTQQQPQFSAEDFAPELKHGNRNGDTQALVSSNLNNDRPSAINSVDPNVPPRPTDNAPSRANQVVSREALPAISPDGFNNRQPSSQLARINANQDSPVRVAQIDRTGTTTNGTSAIPERSVMNREGNDNRTPNSVRSKIPFSLNDQGKQQLAALSSRASSQLALNTTRFVDHVVQPGESLQSISKRYFGNPDFYLDIYLANRNKLRNPVQIESGIAIRIPIYE